MVRTVRIDIAERRLLIDGVPARLRPKSFDLLALLASRPGHLFPVECLIDRVWCGRSVSPSVLPGCIREIRRILDDAAHAPDWIETVTGTGYRLLKAAELAATDVAPPARPDAPAEWGGATRPPRDVSVGVLPFEVRMPGKAAFAHALARDISVGLARTRWLTVAASASAEALPRGMDRKAVARALRVDYLIDGDIHDASDALDLQVALVDVRADRILWADRMTRHGGEVAPLLEEVCGLLVSTVEREIEAREQHKALISPVRGVEPWIGLHRGLALLQRQDRTALPEVDVTLREAARGDPACARIAAARSWQAWQESFFGLASDREGSVSKARDLALESIELDPHDPLGHWALGRARWLSGDLDAAAENLGCAIALNPSFAIGHYALGYTFYLIGREAAAVRACDRAIRLSPLDPMAFAFHCIKAHILCFDGREEEALHHARRIADHPNVHAFALAVAAWVNELCGNRRGARECLARIRHDWPGYGREDYMAALFHQSPWYPLDRKRAIERAFDRIGF